MLQNKTKIYETKKITSFKKNYSWEKPALEKFVMSFIFKLKITFFSGTKNDFRSYCIIAQELKHNDEDFIVFKEGDAMAKEIGALKYLECSALTMNGVDNVFNEVANAMIFSESSKKKKKYFVVKFEVFPDSSKSTDFPLIFSIIFNQCYVISIQINHFVYI